MWNLDVGNLAKIGEGGTKLEGMFKGISGWTIDENSVVTIG
jgi:hypothetical protein